MFKPLMLASLLTASVATNATAGTWQFSYTGFQDSNSGAILADYQISGKFSGSDDNSDGILELAEISSLYVNGMEYIGCGTGSDYYHCGTEQFSYHIGGQLDFVAGQYGYDPEGAFGGGHYYQTGVGEFEYHNAFGQYTEQAYLWTAQTAFAISSGTVLAGEVVSAVPEPATWTMLAAGLLLVGGTALRRRPSMLTPHRL
ncbi:putative secreted protein with PEP-CTERM sorting signal [Pseudoduganella lurida]|uniref:Putative secreted protein with PEP-CTERM sorting signal n=1 Tax=Pseudoduganella lurida TaxID=1036180 RepID=A0A562R4B3_9BURK|nr:PEP-CTERM sorting domain-containing protein [Pseudoduganella lurida]TWI63683.1 putative secreted protein with PEP-CTERM sorting signal [Pseudoduganella lurida]